MTPNRDEHPHADVTADEVEAHGRRSGLVFVRPDHLYKAAGLLFLLALLYNFFTELARILLIAYAAGILATAFNAIISRIPLERRWATGLLGLVIILLLGLAMWFGIPALINQVQSFSQNLPQIQGQFEEIRRWIREQTGLNVALVGEQTGRYVNQFLGSLSGQEVIGRARGVLEYLLLPFFIFFGALYAVGKPNDRLLLPLLRAVPRERRPAFQRIFDLLGTRLLGWVEGTLLSMLIIGALSTAAFYVIGLQYALLLGTWSGLTEFIPIVGPWIGGLTATAVAFFQDPQKALWTLLAVFAIQQLESNVITPLVMATVAEVHPFVTLFALLLFGTLFGFLGVLLALPLVFFFWTVVEVLWVERTIDTDEDRIEPVVEE